MCRGNHPAAAYELRDDRKRDQGREHDRHQRVEIRDVLPGPQAEGRSPTGGVIIRTAPSRNARQGGPQEIRLRLSREVLRQASSGPTAVSNSSSKRHRNRHPVEEGAPTVTLLPCTHSGKHGNQVPHSTVKQASTKRDC